MTKTATIVVTACGKRKSLPPIAALRADRLRPGDAASIAASWATHLAAAKRRIAARELYQGRAFREAELAATPIGANFYVISAGLGLVSADTQIPPYSLTVANGADNVLSRIQPRGAAMPAAWWHELKLATGGPSFHAMMRSSPGLVLLAAGASYLSMIGPELAALSSADRDRLRLFTAARTELLPDGLRTAAMPYDQRLEGLPGRAGTLSDFAQRALRHFAEAILPVHPIGTATEHAAAVTKALDGIQAPARRRGASKSDDEIIAIIRHSWDRTGGKSAATLRLLRDSFLVACEQKRFKKLFALAGAEFAP